MKSIFAVCVFLGVFSLNSFASTSSEAVAGMDAKREGNLSTLVLNFSLESNKELCGTDIEKDEIIKLDSGSANDSKTPDTGYSYEATYLVTRKCHTGTTYAGAYISIEKAELYKGSFSSKYDANYGPAEMKELKIELVRAIDLK